MGYGHGRLRFQVLGVVALLALLAVGGPRLLRAAAPLAPAPTLERLDGGKLRLNPGGRPLLLNFFATWCPPCQDEAPALEHLYRRYRSQLRVIGVDLAVSDSPAAVRDFVRRAGVTFPIVLDRSGTVANTFGVRALPTSILISPSGWLLGQRIGALDEAGFKRWLSASLPSPLR